jgi:hypothetical protein
VQRLEQRIADWTKLPVVNGEPFHVSGSSRRGAAAAAAHTATGERSTNRSVAAVTVEAQQWRLRCSSGYPPAGVRMQLA